MVARSRSALGASGTTSDICRLRSCWRCGGWSVPISSSIQFFCLDPLRSLSREFELTRDGTLLHDILISLFRVYSGFLLAALLGVVLGILLARSRLAYGLIGPVIEAVRPIPPIAWFPLIIIWLGIGEAARISVIVYGAFFPILLNTIQGVRSVENNLISSCPVARCLAAPNFLSGRATGSLPEYCHRSAGRRRHGYVRARRRRADSFKFGPGLFDSGQPRAPFHRSSHLGHDCTRHFGFAAEQTFDDHGLQADQGSVAARITYASPAPKTHLGGN